MCITNCMEVQALLQFVPIKNKYWWRFNFVGLHDFANDLGFVLKFRSISFSKCHKILSEI